jgi:hypothetical protein
MIRMYVDPEPLGTERFERLMELAARPDAPPPPPLTPR